MTIGAAQAFSTRDTSRLWAAIDIRSAHECWPWRLSLNRPGGYGRLMIGGKRGVPSHRAAWTAANGVIPIGMKVLHRCDNPLCCNPAHLFLGTLAANNADRHAKGRTVLPDSGWGQLQRGKTHCPKGHSYSGENVRHRKEGRRRCAACYREWSRNRRKPK